MASTTRSYKAFQRTLRFAPSSFHFRLQDERGPVGVTPLIKKRLWSHGKQKVMIIYTAPLGAFDMKNFGAYRCDRVSLRRGEVALLLNPYSTLTKLTRWRVDAWSTQ